METCHDETRTLQDALAEAVRRMKATFNYSVAADERKALEALVTFAEREGQSLERAPLGARVTLESRLTALRIGNGALAEGERAALARRKARLLETVLDQMPVRAAGVPRFAGGRRR